MQKRGAPILTLDGLRGIAILLVLVFHYRLFYAMGVTPIGQFELLGLQLADLAWAGVDLFFVLSGFLITGILLDAKNGPNYYRNFIGRRVLRIFPLYYGFLALYLFVFPLVIDFSKVTGSAFVEIKANQPWFFAYASNYLVAGRKAWIGELSHFWSLAIEEQFYLVWPLVTALCSAHSLRRVAGVIVAVCIAIRAYAVFVAGADPLSIYVSTHTRIDTLAIGAWLAAFIRTDGAQVSLTSMKRIAATVFAATSLALAGLLVASGHFSGTPQAFVTVVPSHSSPWMQVVGFTLLGVMFASVVVGALNAREGSWAFRLLTASVLRAFGRISYGVYVFHFLVFGMVENSPLGTRAMQAWTNSRPLGTLMAFSIELIATVALASLSWVVLEKPVLRWKRFFASAPSERAAGEVTWSGAKQAAG